MLNLKAQRLENSAETIARMITTSGVDVVVDGRVTVPCAGQGTDGKKFIRLPVMPENMEQKDLDMFHGYIDHECGHIMYTLDLTLPPAPLGTIINMIEDGRVNRLIGQRYNGCGDNLVKLYSETQKQFNKGIKCGDIHIESDASKKLVSLQTAIIRDVWKTKDLEPLLSVYCDDFDPLPDDLLSTLSAIETHNDVLEASKDVLAWLGDDAPPPPEEPEDGESGDSDDGDTEDGDPQEGSSGGEPDGSESEYGGDDPSQDNDSSPEGGGGSDTDEGDGEDGDDEYGDDETDDDEDGDDDSSELAREIEVAAAVESFEKDMKDICEVIVLSVLQSGGTETPRPSTDKDTVEHVKDIYKRLSSDNSTTDGAKLLFGDAMNKYVGTLRTRLALDLQSRGAVWVRDQRRGRKIDNSRLAKTAVSNPRVFKSRNKVATLNTAVTLLIDCSGSMRGPELDAAMQLGALFSEALEMAKVPNEVLGFTTGGATPSGGNRYSNLKHYILKEYTERCTTYRNYWPILQQCTRLNADGESVMWAAKRLVLRREERQILMVLSDGYPAVSADYDGDKHLKDVVKTVSSAGVEVIGIGIKSDAVEDFYPNHVVYNSIDDLMVGVYKTVSELLRTGNLQANAA